MKKLLKESVSVFLAMAIVVSGLMGMTFTASASEVEGTILNGDFEDGTNHFQFTNRVVMSEIVEDEDDASNHVLYIRGSDWPYGGGYVYQDINVEANTDYIWTFRSKEKSGANNANFAAVLGGDGYTTVLDTKIESYKGTDLGARQELGWWVKNGTNNEWDTFHVYFSSGDNTVVRLQYIPYTKDRMAYLDDWQLYKNELGTIQNGGFENGIDFFYKDSDVSPFEIIDNETGANGKCLHVAGAWTGRGMFWQDIPVESDKDYAISFRLKNTSANNGAYVKILGGNSLTTDISFTMKSQIGTDLISNDFGTYAKVTTANTWDTFNLYFNSGANTTIRIRFNLYVPASSRSSYIDDLTMAEYQSEGILNGGFEDGEGAFFERENDSYINFFSVEDNVSGANGKCLYVSGKLVGNVGHGAYWQDVKVEPNKNYIWSFRMKDTAGKAAAHVIYVLGGATFKTPLITTVESSAGDGLTAKDGDEDGGWYAKPHDGTNWVTISCYFNSGDNTAIRLKDNSYAATRNTYIDDWSLAQVPPEFDSHSLVLTDEIGVNFFVDLSNLTAEEQATSYMTFSVANGTGEPIEGIQCDFSDIEAELIDGDNYGFTCYINSAQMAEDITPTLHYGGKTVTGSAYSALDYIDYVLANSGSFDSEVVALAGALGNYGYYSQAYLDSLGDLSNTAIAASYSTNYSSLYDTYKGNLIGYEKVDNFGTSGITASEIKLNLEENISMTAKLTGNSNISMLVKKNGVAYSGDTSKMALTNYCLADIKNLTVSELGDVFTVTNADGTYSVAFSGLSFAYSALNDGTSSEKNVACALYDYYNAAKAYETSLS